MAKPEPFEDAKVLMCTEMVTVRRPGALVEPQLANACKFRAKDCRAQGTNTDTEVRP